MHLQKPRAHDLVGGYRAPLLESGAMSSKTDYHLSRIEALLRALSKEVWTLRVARMRLANGEETDAHLNDEDAITNRRALLKAVKKASHMRS